MRHSWVNHSGISRCRNCHIEAPTWRVKKGGLPECVVDYTPSKTDRAPCLVSASIKPVISCFKCPARLKDSECEDLRVASGYKVSGRKVRID